MQIICYFWCWKLCLTLPELASTKEIRIQNVNNQKPNHPFCKFYHEAFDDTKITLNLAIQGIMKSATKALNSECDAS